jgi:hypothetical protein
VLTTPTNQRGEDHLRRIYAREFGSISLEFLDWLPDRSIDKPYVLCMYCWHDSYERHRWIRFVFVRRLPRLGCVPANCASSSVVSRLQIVRCVGAFTLSRWCVHANLVNLLLYYFVFPLRNPIPTTVLAKCLDPQLSILGVFCSFDAICNCGWMEIRSTISANLIYLNLCHFVQCSGTSPYRCSECQGQATSGRCAPAPRLVASQGNMHRHV